MEIPLGFGFYVSESLPISHQECVNWVPVIQTQPALSQRTLMGSPGIELLTSSGSESTDANRGAHVLSGVPYFINGNTLYRLDRAIISGEEVFSLTDLTSSSGSPINIDGNTRVSIADNGTQMMILPPGGTGYIYTELGGLVEITDPDFVANGNPQYVQFIDGYFACSTDTKKWIISNLNNGLSWDALDFGTAETDPDPVVAPLVYNNQMFVTGSETTEGFQNIGGAGFPFQRSNVFLDKGCYAPFTLIASNQRFFMIGGGKNELSGIWEFSSGAFTKVSTIPIDAVLAEYTRTTIAAAYALSWSAGGQSFVAFSLVDRTFVYNITTSLWHELKSSIPDTNNDLIQSRWRVSSIITAYGYALVGDNEDGRIGKLTLEEYKEYDNEIIRTFSTPPIYNEGRSFRLPAIELTMESGVGNGVEIPKVSLAISRDSKTFSYERNRFVGKIGEFTHRIIWRKNGRIKKFCFLKFRLSDAVKPVAIKLEAEIV